MSIKNKIASICRGISQLQARLNVLETRLMHNQFTKSSRQSSPNVIQVFQSTASQSKQKKSNLQGVVCWKARHPHRPLKTANNAIANSSDATDNQSNFNVVNPLPRLPPKPLYQLLPPMVPSTSSTCKRTFEGGWYLVHAINSDGVPGKRSRAVFLKSDWINWHSSQQ
ncbi:hypothetical protein PCASD_21575 [Puccinia coronata f. sp. avenae]|uniref:Uncharacterized protein n=1 Tax=Puccinia coronata f. sp. avenae TaxID=200324 RepID=A0A2N5UH50_9BASI|nr:hypothetical protein PCASD_21575 [Puccinia coronata f. sp. avenae]